MERLPLPKFSGDHLLYSEFKKLFTELTRPLKLTEPACLEYLKKSLDPQLQYVIRGSQDRAEAWSRLVTPGRPVCRQGGPDQGHHAEPD